ncbi:MAG: hypothetical protein Sapg2KO_49150 [Saprospiraceae bacterium]
MKTLFKITPLLLLTIAASIWIGILLVQESGAENWMLLSIAYLTALAVASLVVDFLFKIFIKNYQKIFLLESGIVVLLIGFYQYQNRYLIFELPENFSKEYVTLIYEVQEEKDLGINALTWRKKISVPADGIILTSSKSDETLPNTDFKAIDGTYYSAKGNQKMFLRVTDSELEQNGQKYQFRTWKLGEGASMSASSEDLIQYKKELMLNLLKKTQ